ncbi:glycine oxidase ThiO [Allostreptomyces psammosilenae]|uniref:glycine oxidase n=1 Tax=Allostreptomyces psammosilenae TaxID=1892865 RepID=A0A853A9I0_9ACTN|nr:glycine oxidase ThiO [Allostreptomyces psammosilenae]NYI07062.1 glycine oxidase [Allostreptomyces psammosilenae]
MGVSAAGSSGGSPDVLVVGGGLVGLAVAWRAAARGLRVGVVDPAPGGGAARVAAGMLAAVTEVKYGEEALLALNLESQRRYPGFVAELVEAAGEDVGYRECGTLAVALDADDRAELREVYAHQRRLGLPVSWLTGREARRLEPMLAASVRGALLAEGDHQVDGRRLCAALLTACGRLGVDVVRGSARRLLRAGGSPGGRAGGAAGGRVVGVRLDDGTELTAGQVVLAAGSHSALLEGVPEEVLPPVRPVKGQVLRLRMPSGAGAPGAFLGRTVRAVVRGVHLYLVPRLNGELVVGATEEEMGYDTTVTAGGVYELLRDAHELVPGITELPLVETSAGLRPGSPDNAPVLGPSGLDGLALATGHGRNGVLLTPVTADCLAEYLVSGRLPEVAAPFTARRFRRSGAPSAAGAAPAGPALREVVA